MNDIMYFYSILLFFFLSFLLHRSETNARLLCFTTAQVIRKTETLDKEKDVKAL